MRDRFRCSIERHTCRQPLDHLLCPTCQHEVLHTGSTSTTQLQANVKSGCTGPPPNASHGAVRPDSD